MRYSVETDEVSIDAAEISALSLFRDGAMLSKEEESFCRLAQDEGEVLCLPMLCDGVKLSVFARVSALTEHGTVFIFETAHDPDAMPPLCLRYAECYTLCATYLARRTRRVLGHGITVVYRNALLSKEHMETHTHTTAELKEHFERLTANLTPDALREMDRVLHRLPTMAAVRFPFPRIRDAQRDFMNQTYRTIKRREKLYVCAPTGTGKTMSVLFPAVRALGEGRIEKVFYLTPKSTTASAALSALSLLHERGADLRGVSLIAKERICPMRGCDCHTHFNCPVMRATEEAARRALFALLERNLPIVDAAVFVDVAREHRVCPYELSLAYSLYADVIVCDYNYVFDPDVFLRRFFSAHGRYTFLVDEAHNLVERARETYSTEIDTAFLSELSSLLSKDEGLSARVREVENGVRKTVLRLTREETRTGEDGKKVAFLSQKELPETVLSMLSKLDAELPEAIRAAKKSGAELPYTELRRAVRTLSRIVRRLALYSDSYRTLLSRQGDLLSLRAFCVDPSENISRRLLMGDSAVFFSATLSPVEYYKTLLGGENQSVAETLESPFEAENLLVAVMDKISTRYLQREETVRQIADVILTAYRKRQGNYLVFCPSFAYMEKIATAFHTVAPEIPMRIQRRDMSRAERAAFLNGFTEDSRTVAFSVMGGIYSEGIDLVGERLIGAIVVGVGMPRPDPERETVRAYFEDTAECGMEFAYVYPGMNRVLQAAGRVIRSEEDRGAVILIDDRFAEPNYRRLFPKHWHGLRFVGNLHSLDVLLSRFWKSK